MITIMHKIIPTAVQDDDFCACFLIKHSSDTHICLHSIYTIFMPALYVVRETILNFDVTE